MKSELVFTSHSLVNKRQQLFVDELLKHPNSICPICPTRWGDEVSPKNAMALEPKFVSDVKGIATFYLEGFEKKVNEIQPNIIYCQDEPYTFFAKQCALAAESVNAKLVFFTWENKPDIILHPALKELEKNNLSNADLVICGTKEAEQRVKSIDSNVKTAIIPQVGICVDHFKPYGNPDKKYDVGYVGRFVPEKMKYYIEFLKRNPKLKSLSIGGRGQCYPPGGTIISWTNYENLVIYYNQMKLFLHLPYSHNGYKEQFAFNIGEALSCGVPVIASSNGSIPSAYEDTPNLFLVPEGKDGIPLLERLVEEFLSIPDPDGANLGRQWVIDNLGLQAIAKRHLEAFEGLK